MSDAPANGSTFIPCLRYRNAPAMIEWLCDVLGCAKRMVVDGGEGTIAHAELTLGCGMLMVGSAEKPGGDGDHTEYAKHLRQPDEVGGFETQSVYVTVPDADAVFARAKARGAKICIDVHDEQYGGRGGAFHDPEGHFWYVGTYDPWAAPTRD